jgi:hypothetical protein
MPEGGTVSQSSPITLSAGRINQSDRLRVELFKTDDREMTLIVWPKRPTPVSARKLSETVATVCRILSNAVIEVAARRRYRP